MVLIATVPDHCLHFTFFSKLLTRLICNFSYAKVSTQWRIITIRSKAIVLLRFSVACFWYQSVGGVSPCVYSYYFQFGLGSCVASF